MNDIIKKLNNQLQNTTHHQQLIELKKEYLGKKGIITKLISDIKIKPLSQRALYGKKINQIKNQVFNLIEQKITLFHHQEMMAKMKVKTSDITQPGYKIFHGSFHPLTITINKIIKVLKNLGFVVKEGSEIVHQDENFTKLNILDNHPSRDIEDTFYINAQELLRTHTSPKQIKIMEKHNKHFPIKIISPGKVYRKDSDDATHSHQFMQIELLFVDKNVTLIDLKATINYLIEKLFSKKHQIRFRPSYFPFTEPSIEVDLACFNCQNGCSTCGNKKWIEILGCGMVHPQVLKNCGIDHQKYQGWALGMGIERIAMLLYGIDDIRTFYTNDIRVINQFRKEMKNVI